MTEEYTLDLDAERESRAAEREGKGIGLPVKIGGRVIATLPPELPLDVLTPLRSLDSDITLLLRQVVASARPGGENADRWASTELVVDLLAANPQLPVRLLDVIGEVSTALFGEEGHAALLTSRLSAQDVGALAKGVFRFYGLTLGEASPSSDSSENSGGTSPGTSGTTSGSTPEGSGSDPVSPALSASATS